MKKQKKKHNRKYIMIGRHKMYILYYKEFHIVKEPMRKNCTCQTYRNKQIAMCEDIKPLQDYIEKQPDKKRYFIEKQPERTEQ